MSGRRHIVCWCLFLLVTASASAAGPDGILAADTPLLTGDGTQVTGPAGWNVRREAGMLLLDAPEADSHVALLDVRAFDAAAALKTAWQRYKPDDRHALQLISERPAHDGWDERKVAEYETTPNEHAVISAIAARRGDHWTVLINDGNKATFEKRGAALVMLWQSMRPQGYVAESFAGRTPHTLDATRIAALRSFVSTAMDQLGVPGASIAVLQDHRIVFEGGIGVRTLGRPEPVDADTLFMAASNTKGMSTLLLATLADEGKLGWEQPVVDVFPRFRLGDDAVTRQVLIKHLVCACTGLPRQDFEWFFEFKDATPETTFQMLAASTPTSGFGQLYQYNNLMAAAAGYIGGALAYPGMALGSAYDKAMQRRIFDPLGMTATTFDMRRALSGNHASPHAIDIDNHPVVISDDLNYSMLAFRPAAGVWTSAHDFIRYVQLEANRGRLPDGTPLVSADNLLRRRQPGVASGKDAHYGMGLEIIDSAGVPVLHHGGGLFGFKSDFYLLPEAGIGAVLLTNADDGQELLKPFLRRLLELVYDGKPQAADDVRIAAGRVRAERAQERTRLTVPPEPAEIAKLAQQYTNDRLGELAVRQTDGATVFDFGEWRSPVASHRNDDGTVSFITTTAAFEGLPFVAGVTDGKRTLLVHDGQHSYLFTEK